tara:strand:+ start:231 stop:698 length:468 start_codon:yes stop_codon:yes gene_type:complete
MISVQTKDFNIENEYRRLRIDAGDAGAIVTFTGLVREIYDDNEHKGEKVKTLFLEHYPEMTENSLQSIVDAASVKWEVLAVRVIHRIGALKPQDQIVFVGVASMHRQDAFDATSFIMDFLKSEAPFWKKQSTESHSKWIEVRTSDTDAVKSWGRT